MRSSWSVESVAAVLRQLGLACLSHGAGPRFPLGPDRGRRRPRPAGLPASGACGAIGLLPPAPLHSGPRRRAGKACIPPALQPVNKLAPAFGPNVPLENVPAPTKTRHRHRPRRGRPLELLDK